MDNLVKFTTIIPTLNNEKTIFGSLSSIKDFSDEIIIIDMHSDDSTVQIAETFNSKILFHERAGFAEPGLALGILNAKNEWILILAADEEIPKGLIKVINSFIENKTADIAYLPRANFALSGFPRHQGQFPEYHLRLFKKNSVDIAGFKGKIHSFFEPLPGKSSQKLQASFPDNCIHHYSNPTVFSYVVKINGYTNIEAQQNFKKYSSKLSLILATFYRPVKAFLSQYVKNRSFLDGWRGLLLSIMFSYYQFLILAKIWEINIHNGEIPTEEGANAMIRKTLNLIELNS